MAAKFGNLRSDAGLQALNQYLLTHSYIEGFKPSQADVSVFTQTNAVVDEKHFPHVARWHTHIGSFTPDARSRWAGGKDHKDHHKEEKKAAAAPAKSSSAADEKGKGKGKAAEANKPAPSTSAGDADPDDPFAEKPEKPERSPFEEDEELTEEEKAREKAIEAKAKKLMDERAAKGKKVEAGRSTLILDVKPLGDDTDLKELEKKVRAIEMEGLRWAGSELVPIAFGLKKLRIISVIVDDLVSTDVLREKIEAFEDCQSTDIYAFNKV